MEPSNDPSSSSMLDDMTDEDILALAQASGITDETDRSRLVERLLAAHTPDTATYTNHDSPRRSPSPPTFSPSPIRAGRGGDGGAAAEAAEEAEKEAAVAAAVAAAIAASATSSNAYETAGSNQGTLGSLSPPERDSPMSFGSPQYSPLPPPPATRRGLGAGRAADADFGQGASDAAGAAGKAGGRGDGPEGAFDELALIEENTKKQEKLDTFVSVTQESRSKAFQYLQATDWSIDAALNLFMESGGDGAGASGRGGDGSDGGGGGGRAGDAESVSPRALGVHEAAFAAQSRGVGGGRSYNSDEDNPESDDAERDELASLGGMAGILGLTGVPLPAAALPGGGAASSRDVARAARARNSPPSSSGGDAGVHDSRYPNGYSEDGVRAPIPNRRDILIGGAEGLGGEGVGRGVLGALHGTVGSRSPAVEEKDTTDWIFAPPEGLSFPSSFVDTRQICKEQKKWLMINIQDHEEFASHRLNKDVWSNETIQTLLRGNFMFWQRNKTLGQARYYMEKYNLAGEVLPHTAIIDPRTGAQLLKVVGYVEPEDLSMALVEFLENNSLDQVKAPSLKTIGLGNIAHAGYSGPPGKEGTDDRSSPGTSVGAYNQGGGAAGDGSYGNIYESFGSEEYLYDDDDDDLGQVWTLQ